MADKLQRLGYAKQTFLQGVREEGSDIVKTVVSPMIDLLFDYLDFGAFGAKKNAEELPASFYSIKRQCRPKAMTAPTTAKATLV